MLRAAVIGCGAIGAGGSAPVHPDVGVYTHAGAYDACPDTKLVALADRDPARLRDAATRWGAADVYAGAGELLDGAAPELVSLCTPDETHADLLEQIITTPGVRGVLAEKPLAGDAARAASLTRLAGDMGVMLAVNYSRRFAPAVAAVARFVAAGGVGEWQHVHGTYGKGLRHNGTHWLDLLRMLGGEPVAVRGWDRLQEGGCDPSLDAELVLADGVGARLAALDGRVFTAFELEVTGTAGRVRLMSSGHRIERFTVGPSQRYPGYRELTGTSAQDGALRDVTLYAVADLVRCVRDGHEPACGGADAVLALTLADAIAASAVAGGRPQPVGVPLRTEILPA